MSADERWDVAWRERERLFRIARRRLPSREEAEDVVAEAVARAGVAQDVPVEALPAWLTRVTVNLCTDRQRRLATQRAALQRAELRPEAQPSHEEEVLARAQAVWLTGQLDALPARQAHAVRLRAQGLSPGQIAQVLAVSTASVDALLKRSRAALRTAARSAGVVAVALWAGLLRGRRPAVVAVAATAWLVVLLPVHDPLPDRSALPPGGAPGALAQAPPPLPGATRTVARAAAAEPSGAGASPAAPVAVEQLGRPLPYDGPRCLAEYCLPVVDDEADRTLGATSPRGWSPRDLQDYLGEPAWAVSAAQRRPLVAVVVSYEFDWVLGDLATYRATMQLPACEQGDSCLTRHVVAADEQAQEDAYAAVVGRAHGLHSRRAGQAYRSNPPVEQAVLLQSASAACPECRLALVVARSDGAADLAAAFRHAQRLQPDVVVTNMAVGPVGDGSFAALEEPALYDGALVVAGGGIGGHSTGIGEAPRRLANVVSVGATQVVDGRVESLPDNASFCDTTIPAPSWQQGLDTGCAGRAGMDVVAPGGPDTALSVYVSGGLPDGRGWYHPGHASQAAAVLAALLARHGLTDEVRGPAELYANAEWFADITRGSTDCLQQGCTYGPRPAAGECDPLPWQGCNARPGWDGATGLGEPRFLPWR